jgi:hypothetical protein
MKLLLATALLLTACGSKDATDDAPQALVDQSDKNSKEKEKKPKEEEKKVEVAAVPTATPTPKVNPCDAIIEVDTGHHLVGIAWHTLYIEENGKCLATYSESDRTQLRNHYDTVLERVEGDASKIHLVTEWNDGSLAYDTSPL